MLQRMEVTVKCMNGDVLYFVIICRYYEKTKTNNAFIQPDPATLSLSAQNPLVPTENLNLEIGS